ncbi:fasciclin domain-containing protein [Cupriavidus sp. AcVe19-1a]|uniref:fasciclin domain-containing protein n=1 Tax=Cupriavidus sp. AcVe19-1a TaxID=2821359 RepID=UPI001AE4946B|nr:fasciclin domain-containing protein [Cupriavidus sp. AcVe19-1a]MBP0632732.1 fasciclin domain-containing protein [Cupriavidus sp. AcVe19-1a]
MLNGFKKALVLSLVALLAACGGGDDNDPGTITEVAKSDTRLSILGEAVTAAELADTLSGPGPYTVFAPTNDAFAALLEGGVFKIDLVDSALRITDGRNRSSRIVQTDIIASNGVIHLIDKVLLPADKTLVQTALGTPSLSILVEAVTAAGLVDTLNGAGPFTVFAPTNEAFAALLGELGVTKDQLLANKPLLTQVLTYHVAPGRVLKAEVPVNTPIKTVQGGTFTVTPALTITDQRGRSSRIVATDVFASNGVLHVIDKVILPAP